MSFEDDRKPIRVCPEDSKEDIDHKQTLGKRYSMKIMILMSSERLLSRLRFFTFNLRHSDGGWYRILVFKITQFPLTILTHSRI